MRKEYGQVVVLSGSTKFKESFISEARRLALEGYIVISLSVFHHANNEDLTAEQIEMLMINHKKKIRMCDILHIINENNYMGKGTIEEIEYAKKYNKEITYMEN